MKNLPVGGWFFAGAKIIQNALGIAFFIDERL